MLFSDANLALRRIANEYKRNRTKVFVCVIHVAYRIPAVSVSKRPSKNEAYSHFRVWAPSILKACGSFYSKQSL